MGKKATNTAMKKAKSPPKKSAAQIRPKVTRIVDFVRWLEAHGYTEEFLARPGADKAYLTLAGQSRKLIKTFIDEKKPDEQKPRGARTALAAVRRVRAVEDDPIPGGFECPC